MKKIYLICFVALITPYLSAQQFTDVTAVSGIVSVDELPDLFGSGVSIADFDNDGDLDFFVGTEFGLTSHLYQNDGSGVFQNVAETLGINLTYRIRASLWFDYNDDELLDLVLLGDCSSIGDSCTQKIEVFLFQQSSSGNFVEVLNSGLDFGTRYDISIISDALVGGMAAADINNDGWLDLAITVWGREFAGVKASLFLNNADGTFSDISETSSFGQTDVSRYQPIFHDFNDDGFQDVYVNVDFSENEFWLNNGDNTFQNIASSIGANSSFNEMGVTIGDYDNDGDFDVYSTNITRVENGISKHNILYKNNKIETGILGFTEIANNDQINVGQSGWDWGTTFLDVNNDGFVDLATTNGWNQLWGIDQSKFWLNVDGSFFNDVSDNVNFNDFENAASLCAFDMDRDGDLDLAQTIKISGNEKLPLRLLENNYETSTNSNNYIVVKPRMHNGNHFAIGAVVKIAYGNGKTGMRLITAGTSFYGQEPAEAFFGLADNLTVDEIRVEWPDNTVTLVQDIVANQVITVTNDNVLSPNDTKLEEVILFPNPVKNILKLNTNINVDTLQVFNLLGQKIMEYSKVKTINVSSLNKGIYYLKIMSNEDSKYQAIRFIKK